MTVTKATLTASADNQARIYGDPNPELTITYNGFLNADGPSKITQPSIATTANVIVAGGTCIPLHCPVDPQSTISSHSIPKPANG